MDHVEASHMQAPSRYLRDELSPSEARAFEEHFFSCLECADELRLENAFAENARAVFLEESREQTRRAGISPATRHEPSPGWWERWRFAWAMPLAAAACLLAVVGVQNAHLRTNIARLSTGEAPYAFPLKLARGTEAVSVPDTSVFFMPYFFLPGGAASGHFICDIETPSGARKKELKVSAPPPGQPLRLMLLRTEFPSGAYVIKVRGENAPEPIAAYAMDLKTP
jgi:Putative zinc-finger